MNDSTTSWLPLLHGWMPPDHVMLVGAGAGHGPWVQQLQDLDIPSVTLIEADDTQFEQLQRTLSTRAGWQLLKHVVGPTTAEVTYHQASNTAESGLLEPESLRALWPNLSTRQKHTRQSVALADIPSPGASMASWLILDCLPALPLLQGAAHHLQACDVIVARVCTDDNLWPQNGANKLALDAFMVAAGFRCAAVQPERQPRLASALYLRDWNTQIGNLTQEKAKLIAESAELKRAKDQLSTQKDAEAKAKAEALAQRDAEAKAKTEAITQRDALAKDKAALTAARDEQAKLAAERQTALTNQQQATATQQQRLQQLEANNLELSNRQNMLQEELIKAEAQIDLIKDLLLREPGL